MTDLYRYLPTFIRLRDSIAASLVGSSQGVLERIVEVLASLFDETDAFVEALMGIQDPDTCDSQYFPYISYLLGTLLPAGGSEDEIRFLIKNLASHYKTKGTHPSWQKAWRWQDVTPPQVVELYKSTPNEVGDYEMLPDVNHSLRAARIDFTACAGSCESICESVCESICEQDVEVGVPISRNAAENLLKYVDNLRPVNVLLRRDANEYLLSSGYPTASEELGHYPIPYGEPAHWEGSYVEADFEDDIETTYDDLEIDVECLGSCETACQGCCEIQCECATCETRCQTAFCESSCTTGCEGHCEYACEHSCQFACTSCQASCVSGCQYGSCENGCTTECTGSPCEVNSCENYCTANNCQAGFCQTGCQAGSCTAASCESEYCMISAQPS